MEKINIVIPSRGRPNDVKTLESFPEAIVYVPKAEASDYKKFNSGANIRIADIKDETAAKKRNYILDQFEVGSHILMLDDDILHFKQLKNGDFSNITSKEFLKIAERMFRKCSVAGVKLWGVYPVCNDYFMREKLNRKGFIIGKVSGIIKSDLRYNEDVKAKEDWVYTLDNIRKFGMVYRRDDLTVETRADNAPGGCSIFRDEGVRKSDCDRVLELYPDLVKKHSTRKNELQIRGNNSYYESPRWTGEILDCSMPMTFDTYSTCTFGCLYCFSFFQRIHSSKSYLNSKIKVVNPHKVKETFGMRSNSKNDKQFYPYIKKRYTMQWGGLSDPFDPIEKRYGATLELLEYFDEIDYPLSFSTKATWFLDQPLYMDIIKKHTHNWHFKFSIITYDEEVAKKIERGVPTPRERLNAIRRLHDIGFKHLTLRMRPFLIGTTDKTMRELVTEAKKSGVDSVSTEFFCLEKRADDKIKKRYNEMSKILGYDLWRFYAANSYQNGYARLNYNLKSEYMHKLKDICNSLGLRMYVSDAHHKAESCNGSCCGLPADWKYSRGQFTEAILIAKEKGYVTFDDIKKDAEELFQFPWGNACGFNTSDSEKRVEMEGMSMYDYIRKIWNTPDSGKSPYRYFDKILKPDRIDKNGNWVYKYNPTRS